MSNFVHVSKYCFSLSRKPTFALTEVDFLWFWLITISVNIGFAL